MSTMSAEFTFEKELARIKNKSIRQFVIDAFEQIVPDYFWHCPASTSGKYHPKCSLGEGGLVRHTKMAVYWGEELCNAYDIVMQDEIDCVIAALLLHDGYKNGPELSPSGHATMLNAVKTHGGVMAEKLVGVRTDESALRFVKIISDAIAGHMGKWSDPLYKQYEFLTNPNKFSEVVMIADFCSSRKSSEREESLMQENENGST